MKRMLVTVCLVKVAVLSIHYYQLRIWNCSIRLGFCYATLTFSHLNISWLEMMLLFSGLSNSVLVFTMCVITCFWSAQSIKNNPWEIYSLYCLASIDELRL